MEWLALAMWILVVLFGVLLGHGVTIGHGLLGVQMLAALGGLALIVVYLFVGEPATLAWIAFALGVVGTVTIALAANALIAPPATALPARVQMRPRCTPACPAPSSPSSSSSPFSRC